MPSIGDATADLEAGFQDLSMGALNAFKLSKATGSTLKALYGTTDDAVLYWAHHEKLCLVDRKIAFMGGLDMCK
jgi:phospholipase D1/2